MKIKIKMDKKVLAEVPAAYALAGGAAGLIFAPKITLAGIALAAAAGLRPAVEVPPIDAPKPEGFPWLNPAPDVKHAPVAELKETKPAAKKAATKAAPAKKEAAKTIINIQFSGKSYTIADLEKIAKDVWKYDLNGKAADLKSIQLFVKPEESKVYYIFNEDVTGSFDI